MLRALLILSCWHFDSKHYLISFVVVYFIRYIIYDWIIVIGYSKHELGTINMLCPPKNRYHITKEWKKEKMATRKKNFFLPRKVLRLPQASRILWIIIIMMKDEESSSLTRRYYRCKQSETSVFWGGTGGRASTCDARVTGAKEGSGGRGDGRVFPPYPYPNVRSFFQSRLACTAAKETASSSLHCVPDLKPIARPPEN